MNDEINGGPSTTYWVLAGFFLLWNLTGLMFYYMQVTMTPETMAENFTAAQQAFMKSEPKWATAAYATAVTAGVIASALMLMRKSLTVPFFILSFVGVLVQDFNAFVLRDVIAVWGSSSFYLPTIVIVLCILEIVYTRSAKAKGWLS